MFFKMLSFMSFQKMIIFAPTNKTFKNMATLTNEEIEQKKQQLKQLSEEMKKIINELTEAGVYELSEDDLDEVSGGIVMPDAYICQQQCSHRD